MELRFDNQTVIALARHYGTPLYVYDQATLEKSAQGLLNFPNAFGLTVRYAMKALPTAAILRIIDQAGLHIDASSQNEVERAMKAGIKPSKIQLTSQELPHNMLHLLLQMGVKFNACSLRQLEAFGQLMKDGPRDHRCLSVRINPGLGSGGSNRTNVGGPSSSFGIWHEQIPQVLKMAKHFGLKITAVHTHIGSGGDPEIWVKIAKMSLEVAKHFPDATTLNLGGGLKIGRMPEEKTANLQAVGEAVKQAFKYFEATTRRQLHLEIEPGTYVVASAGWIIAKVIDVVNTGADGYTFVKLDTGMGEILRPSLYGAQHPIWFVPKATWHDDQTLIPIMVVGHCCESGDILTPKPGNSEELQPRMLPKPQIDDLAVIGHTGAYCSSMATTGYNSFTQAAEVLIKPDGNSTLIRRGQTLEQLTENEL
ncbi:MAG: diaminopimelate decarboxylase [Patescibacteria group bacterium]|jgi:diaminopimelate decarboxylase|nr:diaminopimelate decarboxylase [Patescibacteria group bacterium]